MLDVQHPLIVYLCAMICSSDKVKQLEDENHWVVGLNATKLFCIVCKPPDLYPMVKNEINALGFLHNKLVHHYINIVLFSS